eukprot:3350404-Rhodomonas_salina.2
MVWPPRAGGYACSQFASAHETHRHTTIQTRMPNNDLRGDVDPVPPLRNDVERVHLSLCAWTPSASVKRRRSVSACPGYARFRRCRSRRKER